MLVLIGIQLFVSFRPGIDLWGHVGGLIGGAAVSLFIAPKWRVDIDPTTGMPTLGDDHPLNLWRGCIVLIFAFALLFITFFVSALRGWIFNLLSLTCAVVLESLCQPTRTSGYSPFAIRHSPSSMDIRPSPISGHWYPAHSAALAESVDEFLNAAQVSPHHQKIVGVIAPHAGHLYSGAVAGYAFQSVRGLEN